MNRKLIEIAKEVEKTLTTKDITIADIILMENSTR